MRPLKVGDVFTIPVDDVRVGVGQVVAMYGKSSYFFAVFEGTLTGQRSERMVAETLVNPLLLVALSMDAKIHAGHWKIETSAPVDSSIPLPAYKEVVGSPDNVEVVNYSGALRRPATEAEMALLTNRKVVAPVRVEKALRAMLGLEPWVDDYDELRAGALVPSSQFFGS